MKTIKDRLMGKKFTFDKLVVTVLAINSIVLVGQDVDFEDNSKVYAQQEESSEVMEVPILIESEDDNTLEGSILTIKNLGRETKGLGKSEKAEDSNVEEVVEEESKQQFEYNVNVEGLEQEQVEFIKTLVPEAVAVAKEYNVYPSIIVAQSILESDWGRSSLAVNANNLFGIKGTYKGSYIMHDTKEDDGTGFQYKVTDKFAKYPSYRESVESNARLIREGLSWDSEYYSGAWVENTSSYEEATEFLTGTYATDINYNSKVNGVIQEYNLDVLDK